MKRILVTIFIALFSFSAFAETVGVTQKIRDTSLRLLAKTGILGEWQCTPDRCPRTVAEFKLASCFRPWREENDAENLRLRSCLIDVVRRTPDHQTTYALITALKHGWLKKPWGPGVLQDLFPLLNQKDAAVRGYYYWWYRLADGRYEKKEEPSEIPDQTPKEEKRSFKKAETSKTAPGIVQVDSLYEDENKSANTRSKIREVGTGNIVTIPELSTSSDFVLTAAHLVAGQGPSVRIGAKSLAIRSLLVDNDQDLALLEIEKAEHSALTYSKSDGLQMSWELEHSLYRGDYAATTLGKNDYSWEELTRPMWAEDVIKMNSLRRLDLLLSPWSENGIEEPEYKDPSEDSSRDGFGISYDGTKIRAGSRATGGTSGSFVFSPNQKIEGLVTQSNYFFSETYVQRTAKMARLIEEFRKGRRGNLTPTTWRLRNGMTYRDFGNGWQEASFLRQNTGSGILLDSGNGVLGDPGNGVLGDPGTKKDSPWNTKDPLRLFEEHGLRPGMTFNGRAIFGILAQAKTSSVQPRELFFYAEPMVFDFMKNHAEDYRFIPVEEGADLTAYTIRRFANSSPLEAVRGAPRDLGDERSGVDKELNRVFFHNNRIDVHLRTYPVRLVELEDDWEAAMPDDIAFSLDEKGRLVGSNAKSFLPIIEVTGLPSKTKYFVDVRRLIFNDLSGVAINPRTDAALVRAEADRQLLLFGFTVRNVKSGREYGFTFEPKKPSSDAGTKKEKGRSR